MVFNSRTGRVAFEPDDIIRCKDADDAASLADIFSSRGINWEFIYELDGKSGFWLKVLPEEAAGA